MKNERKMLLNRLSFPNVLIGNLNLCGVHKAEVPDYKSRGRQHFIKAFTLIELLVVVLIIGILSAIALPQYQVAVEKTKATKLLSLLNSIAQAEEVYYLANGQYTSDMNQLDIQINYIQKQGNAYQLADKNWIDLDGTNQTMVSGGTGFVQINRFFKYVLRNDSYPEQVGCYGLAEAGISNPIGPSICKSLGVNKITYVGGCGNIGTDRSIKRCSGGLVNL